MGRNRPTGLLNLEWWIEYDPPYEWIEYAPRHRALESDMSLKAFHIVFVVIVFATAIGTGVWGVRQYRAVQDIEALALGVGSLVLAAAAIPYGVWFLRKLKNFSYV